MECQALNGRVHLSDEEVARSRLLSDLIAGGTCRLPFSVEQVQGWQAISQNSQADWNSTRTALLVRLSLLQPAQAMASTVQLAVAGLLRCGWQPGSQVWAVRALSCANKQPHNACMQLTAVTIIGGRLLARQWCGGHGYAHR